MDIPRIMHVPSVGVRHQHDTDTYDCIEYYVIFSIIINVNMYGVCVLIASRAL
jgi:hypothetical protein